MTSNSSPVSGERDWASFLPEMLNHISKKIRHLADFTRFRSVCPNWRAAATSSPPPQLPWLLIDSRRPSGNFDPPQTGDLQFYSLLTGEIHTVSVPETKGKLFLGSGNNHILTYYDCNNWDIHLLNLITGDRISLPTLPPGFGNLFAQYVPIFDREHVGCYLRFKFAQLLVCRRLSETEWKTIQFPNCDGGQTFYKGNYYTYDSESEELRVIDMITGLLKHIHVLPPEGPAIIENEDGDEVWSFDYLIESFGELLGVCKIVDEFEVYYVDVECENPRWIKKKSIGDAMIFLDDKIGFSVRASDFPGFAGNCVYFITGSTLRKCYLENSKNEVVIGPVTGKCTWFAPDL